MPIDEQDETRLWNVTEGLCATFGLSMPSLYVLDDDVPNACALGRDARRSVVVVTTGLLRRLDPIELEGVIAHELAHVKRGDNGVSCIGITLGTDLRRVRPPCDAAWGRAASTGPTSSGASAVRFPRGLLGALRIDDGGTRPGRGLLLRLPGPVRAHPLGVDRPLGGAP